MSTVQKSWTTALRHLLWFTWLPIVAVVAWWIASAGSANFYFPPLTTILDRTWEVWIVDGGIVTDLWPSFLRLIGGFLIGVLAGGALGVILGLVRPLESAVRPLTDAARAVPGAALLPIAIMFFGLGEPMKLAMIAFISMWPVMLNTIEGVRAIDPTLKSVMATFRLTKWDRFFQVYLPQTAPQVFAGARTGLAIAVTVMVVVEMFGTPGGVGYFIRHAQQSFRVLDMWTGLVVLGIFGYLVNVLYRVIERRVLNWHHAMIAQTQGASA